MLKLKKTNTAEYALYLSKKDSSLWKKILFVQLPYYLNIKFMSLSKTLDIGCGTGRNLARLSNSVGVDHNYFCVEACRNKGLIAYNPSEFHSNGSNYKSSFDTLLLSHVIEHMTYSDSISLINEYLPYLKNKSRIVIITPQIRGYKSDSTHVTYFDSLLIKKLLLDVGASPEGSRSFPLPIYFGRVFRNNELISVGNIQSEMSTDDEP